VKNQIAGILRRSVNELVRAHAFSGVIADFRRRSQLFAPAANFKNIS
jgi:hypothetical protein